MDLLEVNQFLKHLNNRDLFVKKDDLEYYDKREIIRPVLRLTKPPLTGGPLKYSAVNTSIFWFKKIL